MMSIFNVDTSIPLLKKGENYTNYLIPKLSLKINPSDMKDYFNSDRVINVNNIFANNRLGINDSLEAGKSITLGLDFKKENIEDPNKFFELKLASVLRDKEENFIPKQTTLNKKSSNIFGSISNNFIEFLDINYNFAIDNNYNKFEFNEFDTKLNLGRISAEIQFYKESSDMGGESFIGNELVYNIDEKNSLSFGTRRNRKLDLTEYYKLIYEYNLFLKNRDFLKNNLIFYEIDYKTSKTINVKVMNE